MILLTVVLATAVLIAVFELGRGLGKQQGAMDERLRNDRAAQERVTALEIYLDTIRTPSRN